jgi:SP family sugar:H+ symporter-like MFS transporter
MHYSTYQLFITLGILVANCINFGTEKRTNTGSWRIPMGVSFIWVLILGVGIIFFPESPRYDYRHGREEQAKRTMIKLYGVSDNHRVVAEELAEIKEKHQEELLHRGEPWWKMFTGPRMLYRIALGMSLQSLQQLTGAVRVYFHFTFVLGGRSQKQRPVT